MAVGLTYILYYGKLRQFYNVIHQSSHIPKLEKEYIILDEKLFLKERMERSYLIQRLDQPRDRANLFAFGGGLRNGGLSNEAMSLLQGIFAFDYMGSAEFEWGAVPAALHFLAEQASKHKVVAGVLPAARLDSRPVYYLCPTSYEAEVKAVISRLIDDERSFRLKETCGLGDVLNPAANYRRKTAGWLELDNGFMFFVDLEMFEQTKRLFGIREQPDPSPLSLLWESFLKLLVLK